MNAQKPVSLNLNVRGLGQSATLSIRETCRRLRRENRRVYDFGLGQSPFPVPTPIVEALRLSAPEKDYLPVQGLPALREAVADFHRRKDHVEADAARVIVGPGSKELMFLLQIAYYGEIIVPTPCWVSYVPQARIIGRRLSRINTQFEQGWKLTPVQLLHAIEVVHDDYRPRLLVLNYPANPTGVSYSVPELEEIAEIARRFHLLVLSDEIYGQLHHRAEHVSIGRFYPEGTIISSGLSKWCGAGGWRLGTFLFPPDLDWLYDAMATVASETYTSVCAPVQYAAVHAFRGGAEIERYLCHARRILSVLGQGCARKLIDAGVNVRSPDGAFYLFADFTPFREVFAQQGVTTGAALCERLLNATGVAALPGSAFARSRGELTVRLAYIDFDGARALAASEGIPLDHSLPDDFGEHWCENVLEGMERMAAWVRQGFPETVDAATAPPAGE